MPLAELQQIKLYPASIARLIRELSANQRPVYLGLIA
jgi:TPP-dependent 2-oxoacid decarboxylase